MAEKCFDRRRLVIRGDHNNNVVTSRLHQALLEVTPQTEMLNLLAELQADVAQQDRLSILSSDDEQIISVARSYKINAPFKRPSELAKDDSLIVNVINHALCWLRDYQGKTFDYVCLLQPTAPLVEPQDYDRVIQKAIDNDADTVITVYPCDQKQEDSISFHCPILHQIHQNAP